MSFDRYYFTLILLVCSSLLLGDTSADEHEFEFDFDNPTNGEENVDIGNVVNISIKIDSLLYTIKMPICKNCSEKVYIFFVFI